MIQLKSHLQTNNLYVRRQIIRDNISKLNNVIQHYTFNTNSYQFRRDYLVARDKQISLRAYLDKAINAREQKHLPFF